MMGHMRQGTPMEGLQVLTNTLPINLFFEKELLSATARLQGKLDKDWDGLSLGKLKGHIKYAEDKYISTGLTSEYDTDYIDKKIFWEKKFTIDSNSFKHGRDHEEGVRCYTDGSKINGRTGLGFCIKWQYMAPVHEFADHPVH